MGLFGDITGIFGATQQRRASQEAGRILEANRQHALAASGGVAQQFQPFFGRAQGMGDTALAYGNEAQGYANVAMGYGNEAQAYANGVTGAMPGQMDTGTYEQLLQDTIQQTQGMMPGQGMSAADQIALQDAQRLMNENLSATGNLRSGAAGFASAELARRAMADASQRNFANRATQLGLLGSLQGQGTQQRLARQEQVNNLGMAMNQFNLARGQLGAQTALGRAGVGINQAGLTMNRAGLAQSLAGMNMQAGLAGSQMQNQLLQTGLGMAPQLAQAEMAKGAANANQIGAIGGLVDTGINMGVGAAMGGMGIGTLGGASGWGGALQGMGMNTGAGGNMMQMAMMQRMLGGMGY